MLIGQKVKKKTGYSFEGELRAIFKTRNGEERAVVELVNEGGNGDKMLHIFNPTQLERVNEPYREAVIYEKVIQEQRERVAKCLN
jgi:hypothetical protein